MNSKTSKSIAEIKQNFKPLTKEEQFLMYVRINDVIDFYSNKYLEANSIEDEEKYNMICELFVTYHDMMSQEIDDKEREFLFNLIKADIEKRITEEK